MERKCNGVIHRVIKGDTLYRLSKMYGVRLIDIMKENPYVNVYNLQIGDEICIPTEIYEEEERRYYTAKEGESIGSLVKRFRTDIATLMAFNQELYDLEVQEGTIIRIPEGRPNNRPDMRPGAGPGRREAD
ncbi:MAG: LysM peptidoglycan-binding domain-containing protein [Lachnospiraceae bacterium]|nr:LysM peptidoglycan-binding domain-containing protein [Lachnospiraceae bacterium]